MTVHDYIQIMLFNYITFMFLAYILGNVLGYHFVKFNSIIFYCDDIHNFIAVDLKNKMILVNYSFIYSKIYCRS